MTEFSERLKQARFNKGYSLKQLADAYNKRYMGEKMGTSNLSKWENDKTAPNIYTVKALCDVLDVSIDWITGFDTILEIKRLSAQNERSGKRWDGEERERRKNGRIRQSPKA